MKRPWLITSRFLVLIQLCVLIVVILFKIPTLMTSKLAIAHTEIGNLALCIGAYKNDYGVYPSDTSSKTVINALTGYKSSPDTIEDYSKDSNWHGPYLQTSARQHEQGMKNKALLDPWRQPYHFRLSNAFHNVGGSDIWSSGPNRIDENGAEDDVANWKKSTSRTVISRLRSLETTTVMFVCLFIFVTAFWFLTEFAVRR